MTFVILRHGLAAIIGRMVHHFQQVRTPNHYSEVIALDDELMAFVNNLPPYFSLTPDTSLDETSKYIRVHRFLLITEIWFIRISLHRPYLLRRLHSDRYYRSRTACFESAIKDFSIRQAFREAMPRDARESLSNAYREFQTAMISGIYLVLEPSGKDANAMHAILDGFIQDHEGIREMDETTRRELKIIEFLKKKASQVESNSPGSHRKRDVDKKPSDGVDHPMDAHLLLGLHQSGSARQPRPTFPSLLRETSSPRASPHPSPTTPYSAGSAYARVPPIHRLPQADGYALSPVGSGSPSADDEFESAAQSLLDNWCNPVSNGLSLDGTPGTPGLSWGGPGGADYQGLFGVTPEPSGETDILNGSDGSDWSYWEVLVNQIQKGP